MTERKLATASIDHVEDGPNGPGYYYQIKDADEEPTGDPVGPFDTPAAAEEDFREALGLMLTDMIKNNLGLE